MTNLFRSLFLLSLFLLVSATNAFALTLDQAKTQGMVGELRSGYLGIVVASPSAEVKSLVDDVNSRRRAKYQEIAKKNGTSLTDVEVLAGEKAIKETSSGGYLQVASGGWVKKS